ncbi:MAG: hypothetical protein JNL82_42285 [Myxococcales bacterium]|nr:hypothetical protein [Myxococcales bacterium]
MRPGSAYEESLRPAERRRHGVHYTSPPDILKVLRGLFLEDYEARLDALLAAPERPHLLAFLADLRALRFFDPACGSGNFLLVTYRELRRLELAALLALADADPSLARVDLDQLHGLELLAPPLELAAAALRDADLACDAELVAALGPRCQRPPRGTPANLRRSNALREDWRAFLPPHDGVRVLGNPPFVGKHYQTPEQRADMAAVLTNPGDLDYAAAFLILAARYIQRTRARCAFVVTNSLTQGEQVPALWPALLGDLQIKIHFAHRTFRWHGDAAGQASVHVVILGLAAHDRPDKSLFDLRGAGPTRVAVANISPYLVPAPDIIVTKARAPLLPDIPEIRCGNKPSDGGHLLFTDAERQAFLDLEPSARLALRRYRGSDELLNGDARWCLWLRDAGPDLLALPRVAARVEAVRAFRLASSARPTRDAAARPERFFYVSQPAGTYIAVPEVSSERRKYIPIALLPPDIIASNKLYVIASASLFLFGALHSSMHMAWVRTICGRLKSDFQYSGSLVFNNFPWPTDASPRARAAVARAARAVLDAREQLPGATLADLYDPHATPAPLAEAHAALDLAVDRCYRERAFGDDLERFEHLLARYRRLTAR